MSNEAVQEPDLFTVVNVSAEEVLLKSEEKEVYLRPDEDLYIFKGLPPNEIPVQFSDFAIGQKVKIKAVPPDKKVWVYLLKE